MSTLTPAAPRRQPPPNRDLIPCAIYARISLDPEDDQDGVNRQIEDCRALIDSRPRWSLVDTYVDNNISATKGKRRPEYRRLLADIASGAVKVIVVYTTSRLYRSRIERFNASILLSEHGVRVAAVRGPEQDFSTPAGRMLAEILGAVDSHETEQMADRQSRQAKQEAERGGYHGPRPFGYRRTELRSTMLEEVPAEAAAIRNGVEMLLAGENVSAVARTWNAAGVYTVRGNKWTASAVIQTLVSPHIAGTRATYPSNTARIKRGAPVALYQGAWPAIITPERQELVIALLKERRRPSRSGTNVQHLLSGMVFCGRCGHSMWTANSRKGGRKYIYPYDATGDMGSCSRVGRRAPAKSLPARSSGLHGACVCLRGAPPRPCSCPPRRRIVPTPPISDLWRTTLPGPWGGS